MPNGNVRMEVMGLDPRPATDDELRAMQRLVRQGMDEGAVGLSTGLDYIPSRYADAREIAALCEEIAPEGGVYVTHMRGYGPNAPVGMEEVYEIARSANVASHVSHYNGPADLLLPLIDQGRCDGARPDVRHLPLPRRQHDPWHGRASPWVQEGGIEATLERLGRPAIRGDAECRVVRDAQALPARHDHDLDGRTPRLAMGRGHDGRARRRSRRECRPAISSATS